MVLHARTQPEAFDHLSRFVVRQIVGTRTKWLQDSAHAEEDKGLLTNHPSASARKMTAGQTTSPPEQARPAVFRAAMALRQGLRLGYSALAALDVDDITEIVERESGRRRLLVVLPDRVGELRGPCAQAVIAWMSIGPTSGKLLRAVAPDGRFSRKLSSSWLRARIREHEESEFSWWSDDCSENTAPSDRRCEPGGSGKEQAPMS